VLLIAIWVGLVSCVKVSTVDHGENMNAGSGTLYSMLCQVTAQRVFDCQFVTINPLTGSVSVVSDLGTFGTNLYYRTLAIDPKKGVCYWTPGADHDLVSVSLQTGKLFANYDVPNFIWDLSVDYATNNLYLVINESVWQLVVGTKKLSLVAELSTGPMIGGSAVDVLHQEYVLPTIDNSHIITVNLATGVQTVSPVNASIATLFYDSVAQIVYGVARNQNTQNIQIGILDHTSPPEFTVLVEVSGTAQHGLVDVAYDPSTGTVYLIVEYSLFSVSIPQRKILNVASCPLADSLVGLDFA